MKRNILLYICCLWGLLGCIKQEQEGYNRQLILENVGNNIIVPQLNTLQQKMSTLVKAAQAFETETTAENLQLVRNAWQAATLQWERCAFFNFGPIKMQETSLKIDFNPARTHIIESVLGDASIMLDQAYVATLGVAAKGFPAIEFLLFDHEKTLEQMLALFTTDAQAIRRKAYVRAAAQNIEVQVTAVAQEWANNGGNYLQTFIKNSQGGNDAVNTLANKMIETAEIVANTKLGVPLGVQLKDGSPQPEKTEAWRSKTSLAHLVANLDMMTMVFKGDLGDGFDDYLNALKASGSGQSLANRIVAHIAKTKQAVLAIQPTLYEAVSADQTQTKAAYELARELVVLIKVDMMNALGGIVTFNDNDGD
ncbi:imelysin family protein [uncultured Microscilla sp.]|uniref:imelysin family protein n=1 Tax=uncultured Microscilla sp. TaxID=432653 RepID=UPI00260504A9|nr:imelysin family protein [uncultured Microscilla sp.]